MISWSIEAAKASRSIDRVIVSTDDGEIAEAAITLGAEVPFVRPPELSDDHTGTIPVIRHAINTMADEGIVADNICCIYATAPFVTSVDLENGLQILESTKAEFAISVTSYAFPIQRALSLTEAGRIKMLWPENFQKRSQDLEKVYHDAGQFYWGKVKSWLDRDVLFSDYSAPVRLPRHRVQDIDTPEDWERAEKLFKASSQENQV